MAQIKKVLIIGGGIGGMSLAIELRKQDIAVDLVEIDSQWRVYGAGISIAGATLRAFGQLGVLQQVLSKGSVSDGVDILDVTGRKVGEFPTPRLLENVPGNGGIMRPVLKDILSEATLASGTQVRLCVTFKVITQAQDHVDVEFTDGAKQRYDLVVGADGVLSKVREAIFPDAPKPTYTGQGCWRAVFSRPADFVRMRLYVGTPYKLGLNPVSNDEMYLFLLENSPTKRRIPDEQLPAELRSIMIGCGGVLREMGESLNANSRIMFRPLEAHFLPKPWHRGRVLLIGDAAHATTPHMASGAGMAVEAALVLAEEIAKDRSVEDTLQAYTERRYERCRMVIHNSVRLGEIEQGKGTQAEHLELMRDTSIALMAPI